MQLSLFSFLMAVLWISLFACITACLQREIHFIRYFGITMIFILYLGGVFRFLLPVEFGFTREIGEPVVYAAFYQFFCKTTVDLGIASIPVWAIFVGISILGMAVILALHCLKEHRFRRALILSECMDDEKEEQLARVIEALSDSEQYNPQIPVFYSSFIHMPMGFGIRRRRVVLPDVRYTDRQLYYILLHEFTHFYNKDLHLKLAVTTLCSIFWWNPFIYLLRRNLDEALELKCDMVVSRNMDRDRKEEYLKTILFCLAEARRKDEADKTRVYMADTKKDQFLKRRFKLVANPPRERTKARKCLFYLVYALFLVFTFVGSYAFILQPKYEAPEGDIVTRDAECEATLGNTYILIDEDGQYYLVTYMDNEKYVTKVDASTAEVFLESGYELREMEKE